MDNPFFDDTLQDAVTELAGPVGFIAPGLALAVDAGAHRLGLRASGRLTRHAGAANALGGHGALGLGWRSPARAGLRLDAGLEGRFDALDRYPDDERRQIRGDARLVWQASHRAWLALSAGATARTYPARTLTSGDEQGEVQADESVRLGIGPLRAGPLTLDLEALVSAWQVDANVNRVDRRGGQATGTAALGLGPWGVEASAGRWIQAFPAPAADREDAGNLLAGALTVTPSDWWSVRADARRLSSGSTAPEGRFTQWQAMLSVALSGTTALSAPPGPPVGVERLADGRWRLVADLPGARRVDLVGDFNGWQVGATPMRPVEPAGRWAVELRPSAGTHGFMYVIDGARFVTPAGVPTRDDGFGRQVGVLRVPREGQP